MVDVPELLRSLLLDDIPPTYVGSWPAQVPNSVAIRLWDGRNQEYFGHATLQMPLVLILVRHEEYAPGMSWCKQIRAKFNKYSDQHIAQMHIKGDILHLGKNPEKLHEFQLMFNIILKG